MDKDHAPSQDQVDKFNYLSPMLNSALSEMREFSKRKQDGIVGTTKIKILNRLLTELREIVSGEDTVNYLDPLDEDDLPQNSDAVLILFGGICRGYSPMGGGKPSSYPRFV